MNRPSIHSDHTWTTPFSYLAWGAVARLGIAVAISALLWLAVTWSLS